MSLDFLTARDGSDTCKKGDLYVHSPYAPTREADRLVEARLDPTATTYLVLGPCLDYVTPRLRALAPGARVIVMQYEAAFRGKERSVADAAWYPDSPILPSDFIERELSRCDSRDVRIVEWPPADRAFPAAAAAVKSAIVASLDKLASEEATTKVFGWSWIVNSCRSFLLVERAIRVEADDATTVVALSGPSLSEALALLTPRRARFRLVAVSSALEACLAADLVPDLVVSTDGGFWSRLHLYPAASIALPLATPLSAYPSASLWRRLPLLPLDQGGFADRELLPSLGYGLAAPPHGTVAGSAIVLAASLGSGPVLAAGLDLAARGDEEHCRPHAFDRVVGAGATRLETQEARAWARRSTGAPSPIGGGWYGSRSLELYARALERDAARLPGRLYRLLPSPRSLSGFIELDGLPGALLGERARPAPLGAAEVCLPAPDRRRELLAAKLESWRRLAAAACDSLARGVVPRDEGAAELLRAVDLPYWSAARRAIAAGGDPEEAASLLGARAADRLEELGRRFAT